MNLPDFQHMG